MKQTGLIDHVLEALGLDSKLATNKGTPSEGKPLLEMRRASFLKDPFAIQVLLECPNL